MFRATSNNELGALSQRHYLHLSEKTNSMTLYSYNFPHLLSSTVQKKKKLASDSPSLIMTLDSLSEILGTINIEFGLGNFISKPLTSSHKASCKEWAYTHRCGFSKYIQFKWSVLVITLANTTSSSLTIFFRCESIVQWFPLIGNTSYNQRDRQNCRGCQFVSMCVNFSHGSINNNQPKLSIQYLECLGKEVFSISKFYRFWI